VTGTWLSDGRNVDPATVLDTSPRTATLSSFSGLNPNGDWTLFLSDLAGGNESVLVSWGITAVGAVPEPGAAFMMLAALPAIWWVVRRRRR
jgi:subtilisin-like proprotein convertase family protein